MGPAFSSKDAIGGNLVSLRSDWKEVLVTSGKFLCFLQVRPDMKRLGRHYVAFGLVASWLAGMGRYWDTPGAQWWQYAGLGSVAYTLFMAAFLWALIKPLKPKNWSYVNVLTFVGMTAPPAILYAIPVERFSDPYTATQVNYGFLLAVASWRVVLLWAYLRRSARLRIMHAFLALSLPLSLIMVVLEYFQFTEMIMEGMAGNRGGQDPPNRAGEFVISLSWLSLFAFPFLLVGYLAAAGYYAPKPQFEDSDGGPRIVELTQSSGDPGGTP